jgi:N-methylhydantoinase B
VTATADETSAVRPEQSFAWDGKDFPYRPGPTLNIKGDLKFHSSDVADIDPITFEVLSSRLWNINEEHADTIQRVSGSPVVVHNYDFNTCIQTEDGEPFLFAPYIQYFTGAAELIIKYTLENRADNPGINAGDIFISNDPLIAGSHQMDVAVYAPVFINDELFCWVFNACHARDVGGVEPGSFCIQAPDHYYEAPSLRAVKIADANGIRADIEDTFLRFSRIPHLLALELRSQIAGVSRARTRIGELLEQYAPATVKGAMRKLIDDTEQAVSERLASLPDGEWREVVYFGGAVPGDRDAHKIVLTLRKEADRLFFDNYGTDPQVGSINAGYGQMRAAIGAALAYTLAYDHRFCVGGVFRKTTVDAEIGTISAVDRDGAISSTQAPVLLIYMAAKIISKMMYPDAELRPGVMATSALASCGWVTHSGIDQYGQPFATVTLDHSAGGVGAFSFRDGIDQGGATFWPKSEIPDVEAWEQFFPVLYLYRRAALNGGHGKYRGGHGIVFALCGHRTETQLASTVSIVSSLSTHSGLFGGHWGETGTYYGLVGGNLQELISEGRMPASPIELRAVSGEKAGTLPAKTVGHPLGENDAIEESVYGGGGYGDPLERDPEAVAEDVRNLLVSAMIADAVYGVALGPEAKVDESGTQALRERIIRDRLDRAVVDRHYDAPQGTFEKWVDVAERLAIGRIGESEHFVFACTGCGSVLCDATENYKDWSGRIDSTLPEIDPVTFTDPALEVDADVVYRIFICPNCGISLENELTLRADAPVRDIRVDLSTLQRPA